jgi:hypothetical protein
MAFSKFRNMKLILVMALVKVALLIRDFLAVVVDLRRLDSHFLVLQVAPVLRPPASHFRGLLLVLLELQRSLLRLRLNLSDKISGAPPKTWRTFLISG